MLAVVSIFFVDQKEGENKPVAWFFGSVTVLHFTAPVQLLCKELIS